MSEQLKTKEKVPKSAEGSGAGQVGSERNGKLLSQEASGDQLSGAFSLVSLLSLFF